MMEANSEELRLYFQNIQGTPTNKNNKHKMKVLNQRLDKVQAAVLLETGATDSQKI